MSDESEPTPSTSAAARKKEEKARKKDPRSWENVMKSMGDIPDSDKLIILKEKYNLLYNELRRTTSNYQSLEKKFIAFQKDRDQAQTELNKNILAKSKLESLCRELQKQNKAIKDENITRLKEEEEKRREVATNFTERLNSLCSMMDENKDKSVRLREENMSMTVRLTELYNKFQEREGHLADVNRQLDAQKELFESKMKKMELEHKADHKLWDEESKSLLSNLLKSTETNRLLEENIKSMQANLDIYKNQYSDFEQTMSRSNEVFKTFHGEINKLQKSNTSLEKEKCEYVLKWQSCHNSVVEISEKNQQLAKKLELCEKKVVTLEKLCRQLQTERTTLHKQLQLDKPETVVAAPQQQDKPQIIGSPKQQRTAQKKLLNNEIPKEACNGVLKPTDGNLRRSLSDKDEEEELGSSLPLSEEESPEEVPKSPPKSVDPDILYAQLLQVGYSRPGMTGYSNVELAAAGDAAIPPQNAQSAVPKSKTSEIGNEDTDVGMAEHAGPSTSGGMAIKETRSVPITKKERAQLRGKLEDIQSSTVDLAEDLSLDTLPLYKPQAVTDVPSQGGHATLVKESEARTNIWDPTSVVGQELPEPNAVPSEGTESTGTIILKESEGKTELNKQE